MEESLFGVGEACQGHNVLWGREGVGQALLACFELERCISV